jgi:hypothetical protein
MGRSADADARGPPVKYKILMHVIIEARDDRDAAAVAKTLDKLLKTPLVRMAIDGEGIRLAHGDGRPVVYSPTREVAPL